MLCVSVKKATCSGQGWEGEAEQGQRLLTVVTHVGEGQPRGTRKTLCGRTASVCHEDFLPVLAACYDTCQATCSYCVHAGCTLLAAWYCMPTLSPRRSTLSCRACPQDTFCFGSSSTCKHTKQTYFAGSVMQCKPIHAQQTAAGFNTRLHPWNTCPCTASLTDQQRTCSVQRIHCHPPVHTPPLPLPCREDIPPLPCPQAPQEYAQLTLWRLHVLHLPAPHQPLRPSPGLLTP